jgi:hypothetical protein
MVLDDFKWLHMAILFYDLQIYSFILPENDRNGGSFRNPISCYLSQWNLTFFHIKYQLRSLILGVIYLFRNSNLVFLWFLCLIKKNKTKSRTRPFIQLIE